MVQFFKQSILLILLLLLVSLPGFSQERKQWKHSYTHRHFGMREGLLQTQIFNSFQDSYGYLWFSTHNGASRFDGIHFVNFSSDDLRIPSNSKISYFNQYGSAVLMACASGIAFIYPDQTIENYPFSETTLSHETKIIRTGDWLYLFNCRYLNQSNKDSYTLVRFDLKNKTYKQIAENLPSLSPTVSDGKIYAALSGDIKNSQLKFYHIDDEQVQLIQTIPVEKHYYGVEFKNTTQNEWFATIWKGQEDDPLVDFCQFFIENDSVRWICRMPDLPANYWWGNYCIMRWDEQHLLCGKIGSGNTVFIINTDQWSITDFPLEMLQVNDILKNREGNLWFATEEGVYQCSRFFFESYQLGLGRNDNIWGVIKDLQGNVWFSSFAFGFWRADTQGYLSPAKMGYNKTNAYDLLGYMSNSRDSSGRIFQTYSRGIAIFDPKKRDPNRLELTRTGV